MSIRLSDVGMLGATKRSGVKSRASAAQSRLTTATAVPAKVTTVAPMVAPAVSPALAPTPAAAAAAAAGSPMPEAVKAPSSGTTPPPQVTPEQVAKFRSIVQYVEMESLRALTAAAQKNEGVEIFATLPGKQRENDRLSPEMVKAVVSIAFDDIMRRGHTRPDASSGTVTQGGDSGQKTTELAVPGAPSTALMTPAQAAAAAANAVSPQLMPAIIPPATAFESSNKLWMGLGISAAVILGAAVWVRSRRATRDSLPEQVQGWFSTPKRKRRSRR